MKKLKLSLLDMEGAEILNRQQLKNVMGGTGYPGEPQECTSRCWNKPDVAGGEKILTGSVATTNCEGDAGACASTYSHTAGATCTCGS